MSLKYNTILVAVDGSEEAKKAFNKSVEIAKTENAKLLIGYVIDTRTFASIDAYDRTIAERSRLFGEELLNEYKEIAEKEGVQNVETILEYGSPKVEIPREIAPKNEVDLIVCGATGLTAVERLFIGSVSEHITRYAKCDVLIVRNEEEKTEETKEDEK